VSDRTCAIDGCDGKSRTRGWCSAHYQRWRRTGDPLDRRAPASPPDLPGEHWRPIPGWEGIYEASSLGRIRRLDHTITYVTGRTQRLKGMVLRSVVRRDGRFEVRLNRDGQGQTRYVHHLVALAFIGPRPPGLDICHNDGDCSNNLPSNLRYGTKSSNMLDAVRHGTHRQTRKTHCPRNHPLVPPNLVRWRIAAGGRNCLACSRALANRTHARRLGDTGFDFVATADAHFARIMSA
jgi:hypothetical protein